MVLRRIPLHCFGTDFPSPVCRPSPSESLPLARLVEWSPIPCLVGDSASLRRWRRTPQILSSGCPIPEARLPSLRLSDEHLHPHHPYFPFKDGDELFRFFPLSILIDPWRSLFYSICLGRRVTMARWSLDGRRRSLSGDFLLSVWGFFGFEWGFAPLSSQSQAAGEVLRAGTSGFLDLDRSLSFGRWS